LNNRRNYFTEFNFHFFINKNFVVVCLGNRYSFKSDVGQIFSAANVKSHSKVLHSAFSLFVLSAFMTVSISCVVMFEIVGTYPRVIFMNRFLKVRLYPLALNIIFILCLR